MQAKYPYLARASSRPGWRYEWWQYDGHYILKTWAVGAGGAEHYEGPERHEGKAPREDKPASQPKEPEPEFPPLTMKQEIMLREEQDVYRRERAQNDIYSRER